MSDVSAISIAGANKSFGSTKAVRDLDLEVPQGSLCGFLGPNGAGKSTTIRMIMSIIYPDSGSIRVLGGSALKAKDRIGYLPEERGLYRKMRVGEFLHYIGRLKGLRGADLTRRIKDWLERIELSGVERKRCHELSKGMQQKVQFLSSIIHDPELLILDEPFSGLDPVNAVLLHQIIEEMHNDGRTIIFSTHILHQAEQLCDRIFLINHGVKLLDATVDEIRARFDPRTILVRPSRIRKGVSTHNGSEEPDDGSAIQELRQLDGVLDVKHTDQGRAIELHLDEQAEPRQIMRDVVDRIDARSIELRQLTLEEVFVQLVMHDEGAEAAARVREELSHV